MKRIVSLILVVSLLIAVMPVSAIMETYTRDIYINNGGRLEEEFREWAEKVIREYKENLYPIDTTKTTPPYEMAEYLSIFEVSPGKHLYEYRSAEHDKCDYHLYYELARQKVSFDHTKEASSANANNTTLNLVKYTEPSLRDNKDELNILYMYFIMNTLKEKEYANLSYNQGKYAGRTTAKGFRTWDANYVFDVSTGSFVKNDLFVFEGDSIDRQARADLVNAFIKTLEYAIDGWTEYHTILTNLESGTLAGFSWKGIESKSDGTDLNKLIQGIWTKCGYTILNQAADAILDTVNDIEQNANKNVQAAYDILIAQQAQSDLKEILAGIQGDMLSIMNEEMEEYLKNINIKASNHGAALEEAFTKVYNFLSSDECIKNVRNDAELGMLGINQFSFKAEDVLTEKEIYLYNLIIIYHHVMDLLLTIVDDLFKTLNETVKTVIEKEFGVTSDFAIDVASLANIFTNTFDDIRDEAKKRIQRAESEAVKLAKKYVSEQEILTSWADVCAFLKIEISDQLCKQFGWDETLVDSNGDRIPTHANSTFANAAPDIVVAPVRFEDYCWQALGKNALDGLIKFAVNTRWTEKQWKELKEKEEKKEKEKTRNSPVLVETDARTEILKVILGVLAMGLKLAWDEWVAKDTNIGEQDKDYLTKSYNEFTGHLKKSDSDIGEAILCLKSAFEFLSRFNEYNNEVKGTDKEHLDGNVFFSLKFRENLLKEIRSLLLDKKFWTSIFNLKGGTSVKPKDEKKETDLTKEIKEALYDYQAISAGLLYDISKIMELAGASIERLWGSAEKAAVALWQSYYSLHDSLTNESQLSFEAALCKLAWESSRKIEEKMISDVQKVYDDITLHDKIPDVDTLHLLTSLALMQNDFDVVGMGSYLSIVNRIGTEYRYCYFTEDITGTIHVVVPKVAETKYNNVVRYGKTHKSSWNPQWDVLFK